MCFFMSLFTSYHFGNFQLLHRISYFDLGSCYEYGAEKPVEWYDMVKYCRQELQKSLMWVPVLAGEVSVLLEAPPHAVFCKCGKGICVWVCVCVCVCVCVWYVLSVFKREIKSERKKREANNAGSKSTVDYFLTFFFCLFSNFAIATRVYITKETWKWTWTNTSQHVLMYVINMS